MISSHDQCSFVPPKHECRWRSIADKLTRELEAERAARAVAEAKLASALTQLADYEKRFIGRSSERVVPVDREPRDADKATERAAAGGTDADSAAHDRKKGKKPRPEDAPGIKHEVREWPVPCPQVPLLRQDGAAHWHWQVETGMRARARPTWSALR